MKCYIWLFAVIVTVTQVKSDHKEEMRKIVKGCSDELHVNQAEFEGFFKTGMKSEPKEEFKCNMKCIMEKLGQWKNNAFDADSAVEHVKSVPELKSGQNEIIKALKECKDQKGGNECDTAYLVTKCIFEHNQANM